MLTEPKLAQLYKVWCKWFTAMHPKEKRMTGPMIIEKAVFFNDEMNISGNTHSVRAGCKTHGCWVKGIPLYHTFYE
jgi:hypothetical protein